MNSTLIRFAALAALSFAGAAFAASDNATAGPDKIIAGLAPFSECYTVEIVSPGHLNGHNNTYPVDTDIEVTPTSAPLGGAGVSVTLDVTSHTFTYGNEALEVEVCAVISANAVCGDYTFKINADPLLTGIGWGIGSGAQLTVQVGCPPPVDPIDPCLACDASDPNVSVTSGPGCFGEQTITITAVEDQSPITSVSATVDGNPVTLTVTGIGTSSASATGTFTPAVVGIYTIQATATSKGTACATCPVLTADAGTDNVVSYTSTWLPPLSLGKLDKGGSTVPIKFSMRDCGGLFVHDESVRVNVYEVTLLGETLKYTAVYGVSASGVRISDGQYITNFQTASGAHKYRIDVLFNGVGGPILQATLPFSVR